MLVESVAPRAAGGLIANTDEGIVAIDLTAEALRLTLLFDPEFDRPGNRFNDGKIDRQGRFWSGTMDDSEHADRGALYRIDPDLGWTRIDDGYGVTNGPAFSSDGTILYHTDSARRTIYRFDIALDGSVGTRAILAQFTGTEGYPDGMTVDADGCLWVAFWDGWAVRCFSPGGDEMTTIELPVQRPTSVAFGGPALDRLYVTAARLGLDPAALEVQPLAGALLMFEPGCIGIAERPFAG